MFDFQTVHAGPVRVSIDGTTYDVPRFLLPQFKAWCAARQKASVDAAMEQLGDGSDEDSRNARARFMLYWQPAPIDVVAMIEDATTPEGIEYIIGASFKSAGVPDEHTAAILKGDAALLRALAKELMSATKTAATQRDASKDPGPKGNPTTGQPPTSGDSPTTTDTTATPSTAPSVDSTPTA